MKTVGFDVSKSNLVGFHGAKTTVLKNSVREIRTHLGTLSKETLIGIEATSTYHLLLADTAHAMGFEVYVLNPVDAARYRVALRSRGKTDAIDAELIARMVSKEHDSLRPYKPVPDLQRKLKRLLLRRDKVTKAKVMLEMSVEGDRSLRKLIAPGLKSLSNVILKMEAEIDALSRQIDGYSELSSIPSFGVLNVGGLLSALSVGEFASADSFVAYTGLDCRARDSGQVTGKRHLSKRGSRLLRKNLYMAAMGGCILSAWQPFYQKQLAKGLSRIQALVALARKMARTAWSVYTYRTKFDASRISTQNT